MIGDVDLTGDDTESHLAVRLRALEARISASPAVARRRAEPLRSRRANAHPLRRTPRGPLRLRTEHGSSAAGSSARSRTPCCRRAPTWIDLYQVHRPALTSRKPLCADRPRAPGQGSATSAPPPSRQQIVEAQWVASETATCSGSPPSSRPTRSWPGMPKPSGKWLMVIASGCGRGRDWSLSRRRNEPIGRWCRRPR